MSDEEKNGPRKGDFHVVTTTSISEGEEINASGHADRLTRHYGLLSISATALNIDSAWIALYVQFVLALRVG
jgi:hypothetical protein